MDSKKRFLSTYKKDFIPKKIEAMKSYVLDQEYKDPVSEGFRNYLKIRGAHPKLKPKEELADDYVEKFKKLYPKLGHVYFQAPLNEPIIERNFIMDEQTVYQVDYCDSEKDRALVEDLKRKETVILPDDWVVPETTSSTSYRDPRTLQPDALHVVQPIRPIGDNWGTSSEVADILELITGKSEYEGVIGTLGDVIIKDHIHGKVVHPKCGCPMHNLKKMAGDDDDN
ncbi:hypothetical protein Trydic_g3834 [Trypoxylus dichotomus]